MIEESNIGAGNLNNEEDFLKKFQGFKVPVSSVGKDEMWGKILQGVDEVDKYNRLRMRMMGWSAAAIILLAVVSGVLEWQFAMKKIEAPAGKMAYGMLPDSSFVTLNAGTVLKHREYKFNRNRIVKIKGEAFFDVRSGENDFIIVAGKNRIRVVGTKFNVYYRSDRLSVECLSGEVLVQHNKSAEISVSAGMGVSVGAEINGIKEFPVDPQKSASWLNGEFYYSETPLDQVFMEIERQFDVKISAKGFDPTNRFYSGYFKTDNIRIAFDMVCLPMGLSYEIDLNSRVVKVFP